MLITAWPALNANQGKRIDIPWEGLGAFIASLPEGALFSCATFKGDAREAKKTAALFEAATAVVLDHDAATVPLSTAAETLKSSRALVYETKTEGRWRAILPLGEPIEGYDDYTALVQPIREAFKCARESATGAQMWYPPRKGFRYLSPLDGEPRLMAWITGDREHAYAQSDWPKHPDGRTDRSVLDCMIALRLCTIGVTAEEAAEIFLARGELSHRRDAEYLSLTWEKANAYRVRASEASAASAGGLFSGGLGSQRTHADIKILIGPDVHRVADESVAALASDERLFTRDASIVELTQSGGRLPITRGLSSASIQDRLSRVAEIHKATKDGGSVRVIPPRELTDIVRDRGTYPALRHLRGISEVPILRPDGSVAEAAGYDKLTGFYRAGGLALDLSERSAAEALATLREPFSEFPWARPEMIDVPVALICSIACRAAIEGNVPLFVFDASKAGAGKSLLVETISAIANGHASGASRFPGDDDELAKVLAGYARSSSALVAFDNVTRVIQGEALDSALTCNGKVSFRILGQSKIQFCDWYSVIAINGNQVRVGGDTRRRAIVVRLTPASPKTTYSLSLPKFAYEQRGALLSAAIALVRHGIREGVPALDHRPSFEVFVRTIAGAIKAAGGHDITRFWREEETITDSDDAREIMTLWIALRWPQGATASTIADDLGESFMTSAEAQALLTAHGLERYVKEAMRYVSEASPKASKRQAMAYALHLWRDVPSAEGLRITGETGRNALWRATISN